MESIGIIFVAIMIMLLGIAIGMYISTQIKCHIRHNLKKYDEKEKTK